MTVAEYMKEALLSPLGGYYMKGDVFGKKGDFITSPEISPLFGEVNRKIFLIVYNLRLYEFLFLLLKDDWIMACLVLATALETRFVPLGGVGTWTRYFIEGCVENSETVFRCLCNIEAD
jgi:hypothetical protein